MGNPRTFPGDDPRQRVTDARSLLGRAVLDRRGIAATEFALILPLMTVLFFGMLEISDALMVNRRVNNAANALVDLVAQETEVTPERLVSIFTGVERMLEPTDTSTLTMTVLSVKRDDDDPDEIIVDWSRNDAGAQPYTAGAVYDKLNDDEILPENVSLVVAELSYVYNTSLTTKVVTGPIDFNHLTTRWPRKSSAVEMCAEDPDDPDEPICP